MLTLSKLPCCVEKDGITYIQAVYYMYVLTLYDIWYILHWFFYLDYKGLPVVHGSWNTVSHRSGYHDNMASY